jgi:hypothetical protein
MIKTEKQEVLGRINAYFPLIPHGPHRNRHIHQFFYCLCIRWSGNVLTEPLLSNNRVLHRLMGGIYEVRR